MSVPDFIPFDRVAKHYECTRHIPAETSRAVAQHILTDSSIEPGIPFLDAGVGTGRFGRQLAALHPMVVGLDVSLPMMAYARAATPPPCLIRADLRAIPLPSAVFGGALFVHILHLIADWHGVIQEVRRTLRPGTPIYVGSDGGGELPTIATYRQTARDMGHEHRRIGARNTDEIIGRLVSLRAEVEQLDGGSYQWPYRSRTGDLLEEMRANLWSSLFHLTPEQHDAVIGETVARVRAEGRTDDSAEEVTRTFTLWRARWPE